MVTLFFAKTTAMFPVSDEQPIQHDFLQLSKPLVIFDLETTGVDINNDRIIELYAIKLLPDGRQEELYELVNPGVPIPPELIAVHQITDADVAAQPRFADVAARIATFFNGVDLGGFNVRAFDIPLLNAELARCGIAPIPDAEVCVVDACTLFHKRFKRNLVAAVRYYCGEDHSKAHRAKEDVLATLKVLRAQLDQYSDLEPTSAGIHQYLFGGMLDKSGKFIRNEANEIVFNFGKHRGALALSQPEYLEWMLGANFEEDTRAVIRMMLGSVARHS